MTTREPTTRFLRFLPLTAVLLLFGQPVAAQSAGGSGDAAEMARGARLYGQTCGRCHNPRPATERTDRQWTTIMNHMRARANLTKSQTSAIATFMRATNGQGSTGATASRPGPEAVTGAEVRAMLERLELRMLGLPAREVSGLTPGERAKLLSYLRELRGEETRGAEAGPAADGGDGPAEPEEESGSR